MLNIIRILLKKLLYLIPYTPRGPYIVDYINSSGFCNYIAGVVLYKRAEKNKLNPTAQMKESDRFFSENADRVNKCISYLSDEASKECYKKIIEFRCHSDVLNFPVSYNIGDAYFNNEYFNYGDGECFVDCGAYVGDTVIHFKRAIRAANGDYKKIVAFEPNEKNLKVLMKTHNDVIAINAGVGEEDSFFYFDSSKGPNSLFVDDANAYTKIKIKKIDNCAEVRGGGYIS